MHKNITDIYHHYHIPLNLQDHMLSVAAVGKIVCNHIRAKKIDSELVTSTLLLHDMGNIIKFNFDNTKFFVDEDQSKIDHYRQIQIQFIEKYGTDADQATLKIITEITSDQRIKDLCESSHGSHAHSFIDQPHWEPKICYYADMRISPLGIISVDDRFADLMHRYPLETTQLQQYQGECKTIESQLQENVNINLQSISQSDIESNINNLKAQDLNISR